MWISLTLFILAVLYSTLSSGKATEKVGKCYAEFYGNIWLQNWTRVFRTPHIMWDAI